MSEPRRPHHPFSVLVLLAVAGYGFGSQDLAAQGFGVYQQSACTMARGGAAVAEPCGDASAVYFNPAALGGAESGWTVTAGATGIFQEGGFTSDRTGERTALDSDPRYSPHFFLRYTHDEELTFGLGVFVPYAFATRWSRDFEGAFLSFDSSLESVYIQPTVAYHLAERFSLGAGMTVVSGTVELNRMLDVADQTEPSTGLPLSRFGFPRGTPFGEVRLEGDRALGFGVHVGFRARPTESLSLGGRFMGPVTLEYDGTAHFRQVETGITLPANNPFGAPEGTPLDLFFENAFSEGPLVEQSGGTELTMPTQAVLGGAYRVSPRLTAMLDYQWTNWSSFDEVELEFEEDALGERIVQNYRDSHSLRIGGSYELREDWALNGGYFYNTSAAPPESVTPLVPEGERNHFTVGLGWEPQPGWSIDAGYHRLEQNDRRGRTRGPQEDEPLTVELNDGLFTLGANLLAMTLSVEL